MKIKKQKLLKKENGITLVALITTIIVLSIVSTPLILSTNNITEYRKFSKFKDDLLNLKEAVSNVYSTDKELSSDSNSDMYIGPEYKDWKTFIDNVKDKKQGGNTVINPNDKTSTDSQITYYIIDFNVLSQKYKEKFENNEGATLQGLNYGDGNLNVNNTTQDVYIINSKSRTIYYVEGFTMNGVTYYRYQESYTKIEEVLPGSTILRENAPKISVNGLKYADLNNDGEADGIIVADISKASTDKDTYKGGNPWGNNGSFSYTQVTSELREYSENTSYKYTNADGSTVDGTLIKCTNNTGKPRYYILSLADYDGNKHYWYKNAYNKMSDSTFTSKYFGKGKKNTEKMIDRMKNHSDISKYSVDYGEATTGENADIWNIIEDKVEGWFVPSRDEWIAFGSYLNISTTSTGANYGLKGLCWSSSMEWNNGVWFVSFFNHTDSYMDMASPDHTNGLRLCKTF